MLVGDGKLNRGTVMDALLVAEKLQLFAIVLLGIGLVFSCMQIVGLWRIVRNRKDDQ